MGKTFFRIFTFLVIALFTYFAASLESNTRMIIGIAIAIAAAVLMITSRVNLGKSFSVKTEVRELVTTGIYSKIQHPLYTFLDLLLAGIIIITGIKVLLIFWGILAAVHVIQSRREDKLLADAYGENYDEYRRHAWM